MAQTVDLLRDIPVGEEGVDRETLERVVLLAVEIAREGREGRRVGTMFVVGDAEATLKRSKPLILDPLGPHPRRKKAITDPGLRETVKELAQLDGAFIVSSDGVVLSACRYISAGSEDIDLPLGLGSRHIAAASITRETEAIAVVVSQAAVVRVFAEGELIAEIVPERLLPRGHGVHVERPYSLRSDELMTVVCRAEGEEEVL
jgi:DNA integrity scanning protein DisA with diadenylate cyclase activity